MNAALPMMGSSAHAHSTYNAGTLLGMAQQNGVGVLQHAANAYHNATTLAIPNVTTATIPVANGSTTNKGTQMSRRMVQVIIVDPNENIPMENCVLFHGEPKLTDATDQELFFELDIKALLEKHNAKRVKAIDKKVKERTEYLEAAKIRDLKMVVVNIATF